MVEVVTVMASVLGSVGGGVVLSLSGSGADSNSDKNGARINGSVLPCSVVLV